jgi:YD repeat-containing protein
MTYTPSGSPAYAVTKHKDVQHADDTINTVTFIDGLERVIQTKKDMEFDVTGTGSTVTGMSVSGLMTFDRRGRVATQDQPVRDPGPETSFVITPSLHPTAYIYDSLGRIIKVIGPDGATTTTEYFISTADASVPGTWLATRVTDPMGNAAGATAPTGQKVTYDDSAGRHVAVKEYNQIGASTSLTPLITQYQYNPMSELVKVIDAKLKETTATYDTLGQMVALTSPDAGKTEYLYDLNGNLGAKQTAVLAAQSKFIKYEYEPSSNRLTKINYPTMTDVTYVYGSKDEKGGTGNLAGRVKQVTMEGGSELRYYDKMGNVNKTVTTLNHLQQPSLAAQTFTMQFSYDSFGRMQTMTFPNWIDNNWKNVAGDGELVTYVYDRGGNIDKISGYQQTQNPQHPEFARNFSYLNHIGYDEFEQRRVM